MLQKNMGRWDRLIRFSLGVALIPIGLVLLEGGQGALPGIVVSIFALMPITTGLTGICPGYVPFGISTLGKDQSVNRLALD